jgi:hypothetical protein
MLRWTSGVKLMEKDDDHIVRKTLDIQENLKERGLGEQLWIKS